MTNIIDPAICAGKGCENLGTIFMAINYINKTGIFCEACSTELLRQELAVKLDSKENKKLVHDENDDPNYTSFQNLGYQNSSDLGWKERNQVKTTSNNQVESYK